MEKKTPLYPIHLDEGGKMVPFAGYLLPVQYPAGVIAEHMAVRTACGLFDVSHMGEFVFRGAGALATLNHLLTNDFTNMQVGRVRYTAMCLPDGGTVDDLVIYKFADDCFLAVVNAANRDKDCAHMSANLLPDTEMEDISDRVAQLALQGPNAKDILAHLIDPALLPQKYYTAVRELLIGGVPCMVSRTGYTGEFGYELYTAADDAPKLWNLLRDAGAEQRHGGLQAQGVPRAQAWARGTPCAWRPPCRCTATRWTRPSPRWKPGWTLPSSCKSRSSSGGRPCWPPARRGGCGWA